MTKLVIVLLVSLPVFASNWDLNDVSILFPLPQRHTDNGLYTTTSEGKLGPLLAEDIYSHLPPVTNYAEAKKLYELLRVVSLRIDPCFLMPNSRGQEVCHAQIRMSWQPVVELDKKTVAIDGTIHTFYELTEKEFKALAQDLRKLNALYPYPHGRPLAVHPILLRDGLVGKFATALKKIILNYAGSKNFTRVTFMQVTSQENQWYFQGFDRVNGKLVPMWLARVESESQSLFNSAEPAQGATEFGPDGIPLPAPTGSDSVNFLLNDSLKITLKDEKAIRSDVTGAYRMENPKIYPTDHLDCASCHSAQPARNWAMRKFPSLRLEENPFRFQSQRNLTNVSPHQEYTTTLRGFGYQYGDIAISQRTINESAIVADALSNLDF